MKYWEDFNSKYGFSDGDATPPDAVAQREVYVTILNALAEKLNSAVRVAKYDRPGMHNYCLILTIPKEDLTENGEASERFFKSGAVEPAFDEPMQEAYELAQYRGLDDMVKIKVQIDKKELKFVLENLDTEFKAPEV